MTGKRVFALLLFCFSAVSHNVTARSCRLTGLECLRGWDFTNRSGSFSACVFRADVSSLNPMKKGNVHLQRVKVIRDVGASEDPLIEKQ